MQDHSPMVSPARSAAVTVDVDRITHSWPDLLTSPIKDQAEFEQITQNLDVVKQPAQTDWLMARIASFLSQYYVADTSPQMVAMMAEDWAASLGGYPEWAITKAIRWWKSADNPKRSHRPVEGDIQARVRVEMGVVKVAELACKRFMGGVEPYKGQPERTPVSAERAAAIMAEVGFKPKRFGGEE